MCTADGVPVVWAQRLFGDRDARRVYGPDLMQEGLARAAREGWRVAFYGGRPEALDALLRRVRKRHPGLSIVLAESPPFRPLSEEEERSLQQRFERADPQLVWVGLGCPKQERWMHEHVERVPGVMFGVGAAFDFHAGIVRQAPAFLQKIGMEWFFRLLCEPRRLFKRYATTNPIYVFKLGLQVFSRHILRRKYQVRH